MTQHILYGPDGNTISATRPVASSLYDQAGNPVAVFNRSLSTLQKNKPVAISTLVGPRTDSPGVPPAGVVNDGVGWYVSDAFAFPTIRSSLAFVLTITAIAFSGGNPAISLGIQRFTSQGTWSGPSVGFATIALNAPGVASFPAGMQWLRAGYRLVVGGSSSSTISSISWYVTAIFQ